MDEQPLNQENQEKILSSFEASKNRAQKLLEDPEKAKDVLREAAQKAASNKGPFDKIWEDLQLLFALGKAYISGEYREIPVGSIIALLGGLIYLLSPIDVVPDFIPVLGYLDDVFVLSLVIKQLDSDLKKFKAWQEEQGKA